MNPQNFEQFQQELLPLADQLEHRDACQRWMLQCRNLNERVAEKFWAKRYWESARLCDKMLKEMMK